MKIIAVVLVLAACGSSKDKDKDKPAAPPKDDGPVGRIESKTTDENGTTHVHVAGRQVPLDAIPEAKQAVPLPLKGLADVHVDLRVPSANGQPDFSKANGEAVITCAHCVIGDDKTKLKLPGDAGEMFPDGLEFSHLTFDSIEIEVTIENGHAVVKKLAVASPDLDLHVGGTVDFVPAVASSKVDGCIKYRALPALAQRDPKIASLIGLIGGGTTPDGGYAIKLEGTVGEMRRLGQACDVK